ncbi:ABC transporter, partial [Candidatus Roizmanbacteria bacterium CG22_combo_CG10-13_8_21_14_all_33_16]
MRIHRIYAVILRFMYLFRRSYDRISDAFYWPTIDLMLWGLTSVYFRSYMPDASKVILIIMSGILFWIIIWRGQYEITVNLLEDLWNENLIN